MEKIAFINSRLDRTVPKHLQSFIEECTFCDLASAEVLIRSKAFQLGIVLVSGLGSEHQNTFVKINDLSATVPIIVLGTPEQADLFSEAILAGCLMFLSDQSTEFMLRGVCEETFYLHRSLNKAESNKVVTEGSM